jgi:ABC-type transport system involved in multi-copper enzyme maturation permease subunit
MGVLGIICSFLPKEVLMVFGQTQTMTLILFVQILGALYLGFAIMNWMAKTVLIGGIYSKPLSIGNFAHFVIAGLALVKCSTNSGTTSKYIWVLTVIYALFALLFGAVFFKNPKQKM